MKILFDHQAFQLQKYGGISRYFANLNHALNNLNGVNSRITTLYSKNEYIKNDALPVPGLLDRQYFARRESRVHKWNRRYSRWMARLADYDIFHPTYFDTYFLDYVRKPFVLTVHDMIYELMPGIFHDPEVTIERKKKLIHEADALIAISEHTRQDIIRFYPEVESKITVVHHGYVLSDATTPPADTKFKVPDTYILYVGERWLYKNFATFLTGVAPLLKANPGLQLVCAGGGRFTADEKSRLQAEGILKQCKQCNVTDAELKGLYSHAQLFAFPSLQEGFGLPLLEAFANNCPVVCSNSSCMPEIAGNAAIYFDPLSAESIQHAVAQVLNSKTLQQDMKNAGKQRLAFFSFEACVQNTLNVYQSVL